MQVELIEKIIHLPIAERVEIIERVSRSVREDLQENGKKQGDGEISVEERIAIVEDLAGCFKMENPPMTKQEEREIYYEHLSEKYK